MVSSAKDTARKSHYSSPMEACLDAHLRNENRNDPRSILVVANNIVAKLEDDARTEQALDRGLRPSVICIKIQCFRTIRCYACWAPDECDSNSPEVLVLSELLQPTHLIVIGIILLLLFGGRWFANLGQGFRRAIINFRAGKTGRPD